MIITKIQSDPIYSTYISDTSAYTGTWNMITIIENTAFTLLTDGNMTGTVTASETFAAGTTIYGAFTAITLASGTVMAYSN